MAKEERNIMTLPLDQLTNEELQTRVLRMQAHREVINLEDAEENQRINAARKAERARTNANRQAEMKQISAMHAGIQKMCRHRQGGFRHKLYSGDGKPCITKFIMPDGVTAFYQCSRCRLKEYTPHPDLQKRDPELYAARKAFTDRLEELHQESGLDFIKGPTFAWMKNGVPFVPEMAGSAETQKGY
jgi:hypothetical protein